MIRFLFAKLFYTIAMCTKFGVSENKMWDSHFCLYNYFMVLSIKFDNYKYLWKDKEDCAVDYLCKLRKINEQKTEEEASSR